LSTRGSRKRSRTAQEARDLFALRAARVIFCLWVVSTVLQYALPAVNIEFSPPATVDAAMILVAGWLYARPLLKKGSNGATEE
jgi:nucleotide-binding universal stress UspA family protein